MATIVASPSWAQTLPSKDKVALAQRYLALVHRRDYVQRVYGEQLKLAWHLCKDPECQKDLDRAIDAATRDAASRYIEGAQAIMVAKLNVQQLNALVAFAQSPQGQTMVKLQDDLADYTATLAHSLSVRSAQDITRMFCPTHPAECGRSIQPKRDSAS
jgi:hypothetical protein